MRNLPKTYVTLLRGLFVILLSACATKQGAEKPDPFLSIENEEVRSVLRKAVDASGGWDNWTSLDSMRYMKRSILYLEDSTVESDVTQEHFYVFNPSFKATITQVDNDKKVIYKSDNVVTTTIGDSVISSHSEPARQSVMSSLFVLAMPWKLLDPGTLLSYEGTTTLRNGRQVDIIEAAYDPNAYENHSTSDLWWFYFDSQTGHFEGSMVYHHPTYALIENLAFDETTALKFHKQRKSYRTDSLRNIQFLRAAFDYWDYQVW